MVLNHFPNIHIFLLVYGQQLTQYSQDLFYIKAILQRSLCLFMVLTTMVLLVKVLVFVTLLSSVFVIIESAPESALITKLPGFDRTFPSKHYSG